MINSWDIVYPFKRDCEVQKREIQNLREELKISSEKQIQQLNEIEHSNKV